MISQSLHAPFTNRLDMSPCVNNFSHFITIINQQNALDALLPIRKYSKTCVKWPLSKRPKICFKYQLSLIAGQKYCRMLQGEHSAILLTFIRLPFFIKIFVLFNFEWPFYTGCTVCFFSLLFTFFLNDANFSC